MQKGIYPPSHLLGISICYDFVGFIPLDELMKQETA